VLLLAVESRADPTEASARARSHFREGLAAVERDELDVAAREFEAAYAAQPHPSVLYNIAQARLGLGQTPAAVAAFERYLRDEGDRIAPERRAEVVRLLEESKRRLGSLRLDVAAPELTTVWLDGVALERNAWQEPILLVAGEHHLLYSLDHGSPVPLSLTVGRGETKQISIAAPEPLRLMPDAAAPLPSERGAEAAAPGSGRARRAAMAPASAHVARERADAPASARRWAGIGLTGAGAALLLTAGGLLIWNAQRYRDWDAHQASSSYAHNLGTATSIQRVDDLCIGLSVLGVAAGATGIWLLATPLPEVRP
jgi:hypothetical protein